VLPACLLLGLGCQPGSASLKSQAAPARPSPSPSPGPTASLAPTAEPLPSTAPPQPSSAGPSAAPTASSAPAGGVSRCHSAQLGLAFGTSEGAAGTIFLTFRLANSGSEPCTLSGFVDLRMLDSGGQAMPTRVVHNGGMLSNQPPPSQFSLAPGAAATFQVAYSDVPHGTETVCPPAAQLNVTPPDESGQIPLPVQGWGLAPCNGGELDVAPVRPPGIASP
jgi:Protein of unknown function (DUF4232)